MPGKFTIRRTPTLQYFFTLHAENNEKILTSETYGTKQGAANGITSVKVNAPYDARYERRTSRRNLPYFVLKAANGEIIGTSEEYNTSQGRDAGIAAVKRVAPAALVEDQA